MITKVVAILIILLAFGSGYLVYDLLRPLPNLEDVCLNSGGRYSEGADKYGKVLKRACLKDGIFYEDRNIMKLK